MMGGEATGFRATPIEGARAAAGSFCRTRVVHLLALAVVLICGSSCVSSQPNAAIGSSSDGIVLAPLQSQVPTNVIRIQNNLGPSQPSRLITLGYVFAKGDLPSAAQLGMTVGGNPSRLQVDQKASNADGSVRHAILTFQVPALSTGNSVDVELSNTGGAQGGAPVDVAATLARVGYQAELRLMMHNPDGTTTPLTFDIVKLTVDALRNGRATTWLTGPLATEVRVDTPINEWMHARFDVRAYSDGTVRTDVSVLNDSIAVGETTFAYDLELRQNGLLFYSLANVQHIRSSGWHREMWSTGNPKFNIVRNMDYLARTGAIPDFDFTVAMNTGAKSSLVADSANLQKPDKDTGHLSTDPMGSAGTTKYMPMTGGRPDIGILPAYTSRYLALQNDMAAANMLARADGAGSVPWHFRDPATNGPVIKDHNHPLLWIDVRYLANGSQTEKTITKEQWSALLGQPNNNWFIDAAHEPDLAFVPYLLTGSRYYLDELQAQGIWNSANSNLGYGLPAVANQVRGEAWSMRQISDAAFITPDNDPLKSYFTEQMDLNMDALVKGAHTVYSQGEISGAIVNEGKSTAPWQDGFYVAVLNLIAQRGDTRAITVAQRLGNFVSGLYTNADHGMNPYFGPGYWDVVIDPKTNAPIMTWADYFNYNFENGLFVKVRDPKTGASVMADPHAKTLVGGNPTGPDGYVVIARAANAALYSATRDPRAIQAFGFIVAHNYSFAGDRLFPDSIVFLDNNVFSQNPRLKNGKTLASRNILAPSSLKMNSGNKPIVNTNTCATPVLTTGRDEDELIYGDDACDNFTIKGGNGIDLLFAGDGNNVTVNGGAGDDYLFGGAGTDRLYAAGGQNYIRGGLGAMTFVMQASDNAQDTVVGFKSGDVMEIHGLATPVSSLIGGATTAKDGSAELHLSATHTVILAGQRPSAINPSQFVLK